MAVLLSVFAESAQFLALYWGYICSFCIALVLASSHVTPQHETPDLDSAFSSQILLSLGSSWCFFRLVCYHLLIQKVPLWGGYLV